MRSKLIEIATGEIGYLEKKNLNDLDSKTANAGDLNYTKYWRDLAPNMQGQPWCDAFVDWCFVKAYGMSEAQRLECGGTGTYYTPTSAECYKRTGRWSEKPQIGAQVFFRNSERIYHTGIVDAYNNEYITTIEGNTSSAAGVVANGGGVWHKAYSINDPKIAGYGIPDFKGETMIYTSPTKVIAAVRNVYLTAHNEHYQYGDSHGMPPTSDHFISCDRLEAKACWDLGWQNQPQGGITVINMEYYLIKWGWKKIGRASDLKAGDFVLMKQSGQDKPTAAWHTFVLTAYNPDTGICSKYDTGSQSRIEAVQPFRNVPLNEWQGQKQFYCGFRCPQKPETTKYKVTVNYWKSGTKSNSVKLARMIMRAEGYKGSNGRLLAVDNRATGNCMYALETFKKDHKLQNPDMCGVATWQKLVEIKVDTEYEFGLKSWVEGDAGKHVLLAQKLLRALGYVGKDKKVLNLDGIAGENTMYAFKSFQRKSGMKENGECKIGAWRRLLGVKIQVV